jgi:uncharacterized membrane protein
MWSIGAGKRALLALGVGLAAMGAASSVASAATDIVFCNKTGSTVSIALVYMDQTSGAWMLSAWKTRNPGQCASAGAVKTGLIYYYAEKQGTQFRWPADANIDKTFCVPRAAVSRPSGATCGVDEKRYGFRGVVADGPKYTVNFQ